MVTFFKEAIKKYSELEGLQLKATELNENMTMGWQRFSHFKTHLQQKVQQLVQRSLTCPKDLKRITNAYDMHQKNKRNPREKIRIDSKSHKSTSTYSLPLIN